jgi:hypothetical protein
MRKIASPQQLQAKLQALLDYASRPERPQRRVIASRLQPHADAVEGKPRTKTAGRLRYYANPYDRSHEGFYFKDHRDYEKQWKERRKAGGPEEYEIDFIDGPRELGALFEAAQVNQANFEEWEELVDADEDRWAAAYWLLECHGERDIRKVVRDMDDVSLMEGSAKEYAEEYVDSMGGPAELGKEILERYFDMDSFARDMELGGDVQEFRFGNTEYTVDVHSV